MTHELKILQKYFRAVKSGRKNFELRKDDRGYKVGDTIQMYEITGVPVGDNKDGYTGRTIKRKITYILRDCPEYGLEEGYCILGL